MLSRIYLIGSKYVFLEGVLKILYYVHALVIGGAETIVANNLIELKANQVDVVLVVNQRVDTFLEKRVLDAGIKI